MKRFGGFYHSPANEGSTEAAKKYPRLRDKAKQKSLNYEQEKEL